MGGSENQLTEEEPIEKKIGKAKKMVSNPQPNWEASTPQVPSKTKANPSSSAKEGANLKGSSETRKKLQRKEKKDSDNKGKSKPKQTKADLKSKDSAVVVSPVVRKPPKTIS